MGMDVIGTNPKNKTGEYFRNNCWWWRPLWDYCREVAPELAGKVVYYGSNDGDGLNGEDSKALAKVLKKELGFGFGHTAQYSRAYARRLAALPTEPCDICAGTGKRKAPPVCGAGAMPCNGCDSTGRKKAWETNYPFSTGNVREFVKFLENCGGFEIC